MNPFHDITENEVSKNMSFHKNNALCAMEFSKKQKDEILELKFKIYVFNSRNESKIRILEIYQI